MPDDETTPEDRNEKKIPWAKAGVAVGIGSAAIVAALLYANRTRDKGGKKP